MWRLSSVLIVAVLSGSTVAPASASVGSSSPEASPVETSHRAVGDLSNERTQCSQSLGNVQQNMTGEGADAIEEAQGLYEDLAGFRAVVHDGARVVIVVSPTTVGEWQKRLAGNQIGVVASCVSDELIAAGRAALGERAVSGDDYTLAGYDASRDAFVVRSTLVRGDLISSIAALLPVQAQSMVVDDSTALRVVQVSPPGRSPRISRGSDDPPYKGGARIKFKFPEFGFTTLCTPAFYVNSAANGTVLVSAGHCSLGENGRWVWNGDLSGLVGETEGNRFPDPDLMLIDGSLYVARSYAAGDQSTIKDISGSANPSTYTTYCQYGATSLRRCSQYISLSAQFCDAAGCTNDLAYTEGPSGPGGSLGSGGDSGGGVFREITGGTISARGVVVAAACGVDIHGDPDISLCWRADHKRQTVMNTYNATIVVVP